MRAPLLAVLAPLLCPALAQADRTVDAESLTMAARSAERNYQCDTVDMLSGRVHDLDPAYHARVFATDPTILSCGNVSAEPRSRDGFGGKLGFGLGMPYGGMGAGIELGLPHVAFAAGMGAVLMPGNAQFGYSAGVRGYLVDRTHAFRPSLTALYGVTGAVCEITDFSFTCTRSYPLYGVGIFAGFDHDVGAPGAVVLTYGFGVLVSDVPDEIMAERTSAKLMFGVNYEM
jgi:hypothetical protein